MSKAEYISKIKGMIDKLYRIADEFDAKGIHVDVPGFSPESGMRDVLRADVLMFVLRFSDNDKKTNLSCAEYLNECTGLTLSPAEIDTVVVEAKKVNMTTLSTLLPFFILIDKGLGGDDFSSTYVKILCYVSIGFFLCQDRTSIGELTLYYKCCDACVKSVERILHTDMKFDPLENMDDNRRKLVQLSVELEKLLNKDERELWIQGTEKVVQTAEIEKLNKGTSVTKSLREEVLKTTDEYPSMQELNDMIGLKNVKDQVRTMINVRRVQKRCAELSIQRSPIAMHMVFTGNPGTGKTSVARILGKVYKEAGLLSKGQFIEVSRAELVGKYVGHTADMVSEVFKKAQGGILFIDEAYMLTREIGDYGQEALETLLKLMEDNRDDIVVIAAGYPDLMQEFLDSNPGVRSRFPFIVQFDDYSEYELYRIFCKFCKENEEELPPSVRKEVRNYCKNKIAGNRHSNGNARAVRNLFERMIMNQANRVVGQGKLDKPDICRFLLEDLPEHDGSQNLDKGKSGVLIDFV